MKKNISDMLRSIKSKKLTPEEKNYLWSNISDKLELDSQTQKVDQRVPSGYFVIFSYKKVIAAVTLVAFLIFGTATASAFDDIKPGDFFFPVDVAAEKILLTLTFGDTEDTFRLRFAEERIEEILALLALAESVEIEGTGDTSTEDDEGDGDDTDTTTAASNDDESDTATESDEGDGTNENGVDLVEEKFLNSFDFDIDTVGDALLFALAQLEESKAVFAANGNANGVVAINSFIDQLNDLTLNHINKLDRVAVSITDGGNEDVKIKITASSAELKMKFEFTETTDSDGSTTQKVTFRNEETTSSLKSDEDGGFKFSFNFRKKKDDNKDGKDGDDGEDGEDGDDGDDGKGVKKNKNKINVCHKGKKTLSVSKNARWAHLFHGDSLGPCAGDAGAGDGDGDGDDTTTPVITDVEADPAITTAEVTWDTDEDATSKVWYSTTSSVVTDSPTPMKEDAALTHDHILLLDGLVASTTYYYVVVSEDESGNVSTSTEHSFETLQQPEPGDTTAPVISNLTAVATTTSADVTWDTDEGADSTVYYSSTAPVDTDTADKVESSSLVTSHSLELSSLTSSTTYYYVVISTDGSGNTATSTEESFETTVEGEPEPEDTTAPVLSNIDAVATTTEAVVTWNTDEDANSKVYYSDISPVDPDTADSVSGASFVTSHSLDITSLMASTTYFYLVVSSDESGNTSTSTENSFTTNPEPEPEDTTAPVISAITPFDVGTTTIAISWTTDEGANGKLWYSTDDPLIVSDLVAMVNHADFETSHSLFLGGLVASTTYQFLIVSTDEANNIATSTQQTFTTTSE